jgi:hypothetical protein
VNADGLWIGDRLYVGGVQCGTNPESQTDDLHCNPAEFSFYSYEPQAEAWSALPVPPTEGLLNVEQGDWGRFADSLGPDSLLMQAGDAFWRFSISAQQWTEVASPQLPAINAVCTNGMTAFALSAEPGDPVGEPALQPDGGSVGVTSFDGALVSVLTPNADAWSAPTELKADLAPTDYPQLLCSDNQALVYSNGLSHAWLVDPAGGAATAIAPPTDELRTQPGFDGPEPVNLPVEFRYAAWTGSAFAFWNSDVNVEVPLKDDSSKSVTAHRPGNAVVLDVTSHEWRSATPGQGGSTLQFPHQVAWSQGFGFVPTLVDQKPTVQLYRPI